MKYVLSVDLGQQQDPTAFVLNEHRMIINNPNLSETPTWEARPKKIRNEYVTRMIERPPLNTSYVEIVDMTEAIMNRPALQHETYLVVDATGVGMPVVDMLADRGLNPVGIWISAGDKVVPTDYGYRVPKKDLAVTLQVIFQTRRIKIVGSMELASVAAKELRTFRVKQDENTAKQQWAAWRVGEHDDIVLAEACGLWFAERVFPQTTILDEAETSVIDWNPLDV